ncbi:MULTISPECIES: hypothetical protein [unclassified Marinitoga]|uniref:hypothetical protein n=1 Tax=unclassified Marinitoga TaxID=2640159 RepID=UPI0006414D70|nr:MULTISPECIES: hypothetical protein [unclassified Marinitoga]KLO23955.1 hypothetical protein X274_05105 [Marinitoga sp. 1155]NUU99090.1 hypothetical protein [Marinitoga sp. 1154]
MKKYTIFLILNFLAIITTFIVFVFSIKYNIENYEQIKDINYLKNVIIAIDNNLKENIFHYVKYNHILLKPFKLILYKNNKIVFSDFENPDNKDFYFNNIEIGNDLYSYGYDLSEYVKYINNFFDSLIFLEYNNKFYPESLPNTNYKKLKLNDIYFYIIFNKNFTTLLDQELPIFITINILLFSLLLFLIYKIFALSNKELNNLFLFLENNENIELKTKEGIFLKEKIKHIINESKNKKKEVEELKTEIKKINTNHNNLINEFIFYINTPLQTLINSISLNLSEDIEKKIITNIISEINIIINKFKTIFYHEYNVSNQNFFEFFDINEFHSNLIYFLSIYIDKNDITVEKEINTKNKFVFTNKNKLYKVIYEILLLIFMDKSGGRINILYTSTDNFLEIKIIDNDNIFNDYILLLNNKSLFDKSNMESYKIESILKYIDDLNGKIFLTQSASNSIIKIEIPIDINEFIINFDFNALKSLYLAKLIEKKYTINQAEKYLYEFLSIYVDVLKNPQNDTLNDLIAVLEKNDFYLLTNWLKFILKYPDNKNIVQFKNLLIKKLESL